jgi:aromatic ring-opening dioxygenase LigB subunit
MPFSALIIAPHGAHAVPRLMDPEPADPVLHGAYLRAREESEADRVDTWVVVTPHGVRAEGAITLSATREAAGEVAGNRHSLSARYDVDLELARAIFAEAQGLPLLPTTFGADVLPLDWGVIIPLHFLARPDARLVVLCPSRSPGFAPLVDLGRAVARAAEASPARVGLVASSDLCHTHRPDGPYGYHPEALRLDREIVAAVEADDLDRLYAFPPERVEQGKPDGLWQIAVADGARRVVPFRFAWAAYACPTYYGMMVALYRRV